MESTVIDMGATTEVKQPAVKKIPAKKPSAKKVVANKASVKTAAAKKVAAKKVPAKKATAKKATAKKAAPTKSLAPSRKKPAPSTSAPATKTKKVKLVRDSFTMPANEYQILQDTKKASLKAGFEIKKSELLRIGVGLLKTLSVTQLAAARAALTKLHAGRPKK
jgi:hypothetical protein